MIASSRVVGALAVGLALVATPGLAQGKVQFSKEYAFPERAPRTKLEQLIDSKLPSIVKVHGASGLSGLEAYASGVVVSKEGHILSLDLIQIQKDRTRVVFPDGSVHFAELLPPDDKMGLRLLKVDPSELDFELQPMWPDDGEVRNGSFVISLGNCYRLAEFSEKVSAMFGVVCGRVSSKLRFRLSDVDDYGGELLLTDAANNPGHYGGALITLDGRFVGLNGRMVESKETNSDLSIAIPAADLLPYLREWVLGEDVAEDAAREVVPVYHGIRLFDRGGLQSPPAYVERVSRRSPAGKMKLRPDDLIVRIDEHGVRSCAEFRRVMERFKPGDTVTVTYKRGDVILKGTMTLEEEKN